MSEKSRKMSKFRLGFLTVLIVIAVTFTVAARVMAADKEPILIGQVGDLTSPSSFAGISFRDGVRDWFSLVNKKGGFTGREVKILFTDGAYDLSRETAAFKKYSMENIVAFFDWSSGGALQISPLCAEKKIVNFGGGINEAMSDTNKYPYRFLHCASYEQSLRVCIDYQIAKHPGKKQTAAIVYPDSGYGHIMLKALREHLSKRDIAIVTEEIVNYSALDSSTQMLKVKAANPDFVVTLQTVPVTAMILKDAVKVGIDTKKMQFYNNLSGAGYELPTLAGDAGKDFLLGISFSDTSEPDVPGIKQLLDLHAGKQWRPTSTSWYLSGWVAARVLSEGLKTTVDKGEKVTGENVKKNLETLKDFHNDGLTSPITFSPSRHIGAYGVKLARPNLKKMEGLEVISDWIYPK